MKGFNKFVCIAVMPIIAFTTSCDKGYGKKVSFNEAYDYVLNHYDKHMLDYIHATYTAKINAFSLNGSTSAITTEGSSVHNYNHDFSKLTIDVQNLYAVCFTTEALSLVQYYYSAFLGASVEHLTGLGAELNYYLNSGNLSLVLSTTKDTIGNLVNIIQQVYSLAGVLWQIDSIKKIIKGYLPDKVVNVLDKLLNVLTFSPSSYCNGTFNVGVTTDGNGFLKTAFIRTTLDYDLGFGLYSGDLPDPAMTTFLETKGKLNFDITLSGTFR